MLENLVLPFSSGPISELSEKGDSKWNLLQ